MDKRLIEITLYCHLGCNRLHACGFRDLFNAHVSETTDLVALTSQFFQCVSEIFVPGTEPYDMIISPGNDFVSGM